jgi:hypothetical protein
MIISCGNSRRVFIFNKIVIKTPRSILGLLSNISEILMWYKYRNMRHLICPIFFHDILGLIIIMPNLETNINQVFTNETSKYIDDNFLNKDHPILYDTNTYNFGIYKGKVVKLDYGNSSWLINIILKRLHLYNLVFKLVIIINNIKYKEIKNEETIINIEE